jgi:YHS domain-containing protein
MKSLKSIAAIALLAGAASLAVVGCKTEGNENEGHSHHGDSASARPYTMDKCLVSGEALEPGKQYTFVHDGQEVKLCCKDCLADFNKNPEKYMAKLRDNK